MERFTIGQTTFLLALMFLALQVFGIDALMKDLSNLNEIQSVFQTDTGKVRIIALLSPT